MIYAPRVGTILCCTCEETKAGPFPSANIFYNHILKGSTVDEDDEPELDLDIKSAIERSELWFQGCPCRMSITDGRNRGMMALGFGSSEEKRSRAAHLAIALAVSAKLSYAQLCLPKEHHHFGSLIARAMELLNGVTSYIDPNTNCVWWHNEATGEATWGTPYTDTNTNAIWWHNEATGQAAWQCGRPADN